MNTKALFFAISIIPLLASILSGCSESSKEADPLPEIVSAVTFPFIKDKTLYSFDPESGELEPLVTAEKRLFLALDVDQSNKEEDEDNNAIFSHSIEAEYIAYANNQTLHVYDLNTRHDHTVFSFKDDLMFVEDDQDLLPAPESYICDIQKVITLDEDSRLARQTLYKDELRVYVKTSTNSECSGNQENYNYWQIDILESTKLDPYTVRRKILLEHEHKHTHFHDHDDPDYEYASEHTHEHTLETGEPDPNNNNLPFDPNNHEHSHKHTHDFIYAEEHAHDFLTKEEIDSVHNAAINQEIVFESHPVLIGRKSSIDSIDEALMYSGKPVVDLANRDFGYLGFNSTESAYKFYSVDLDELDKTLLWELESSDFENKKNTSQDLSDLELITQKYNRPSHFDYIESNILISANNKLFYFSLDELFDDDEAEARNDRLNNPLFISYDTSSDISERYIYHENNQTMVITEGMKIYTIAFSGGEPTTTKLTKHFQENSLINIKAKYLGEALFVVKTFADETTSIIALSETGLEEQTIIPRSWMHVDIDKLDLNVYANITDLSNNTQNARFYNTNFSEPTGTLQESLWMLDSVDYRNNKQEDIISILSSDNSSIANNTIASPRLYLFDKDKTLGRGEEFGEIPQSVAEASKMVIYNDLYGLAEVVNEDDEKSTYFFSNSKTSFNFNNEFKIMKELE